MANTEDVPYIMIIEDEPLLLEAIKKRFDTKGFTTSAFASAEEALDYLKKGKEEGKLPKVIWLDYYLTGMDGLSFVKELKKDTELADIPVLVISNSASDEKVKQLMDEGVEKYLLKANYRLDDLISSTTEFLHGTKKEG